MPLVTRNGSMAAAMAAAALASASAEWLPGEGSRGSGSG